MKYQDFIKCGQVDSTITIKVTPPTYESGEPLRKYREMFFDGVSISAVNTYEWHSLSRKYPLICRNVISGIMVRLFIQGRNFVIYERGKFFDKARRCFSV